MDSKKQSICMLVVSMFLFGTIGAFVKHIPLQSSLIALIRAAIGLLFLLVVITLKKHYFSFSAVRKNILWLIISGCCLGFNWIFLFESYRYTSVAISTVCYYMAPILVILASPLVLKETISTRKLLCVVVAICGMICISGVLRFGLASIGDLRGILLGLMAAVLYATIILCNKKLTDISAYDRTIIQLAISAVVMLPYCVATYVPVGTALMPTSIVLLLIIGVVHTGVTYYLYFGSMEHLSGQSVAIISYIDPLIAVLVSVMFLKEQFAFMEGLGALLILGAAMISEMPARKKA